METIKGKSMSPDFPELRKFIIKKLEKTKDCKFKEAWIPKEWACVKIKKFASELAREIGSRMKELL